MPFEIAPLIPVIGTVAAALVAGGIARANLIASKETKISEFRQAWINAVRDDLAALFSNVRTLARALQESRFPQGLMTAGFGIEPSKITAVRHGAAETYHRIRLRLNAGQLDHKELLRLLGVMMDAQQSYMVNPSGSVDEPIAAVEAAALYAEGVLKSEWKTVKLGESEYRASLRTTSLTLRGAFGVLAAVVIGIPVYSYWPSSADKLTSATPAVVPKVASAPASQAAAAVPAPRPTPGPAASIAAAGR